MASRPASCAEWRHAGAAPLVALEQYVDDLRHRRVVRNHFLGVDVHAVPVLEARVLAIGHPHHHGLAVHVAVDLGDRGPVELGRLEHELGLGLVRPVGAPLGVDVPRHRPVDLVVQHLLALHAHHHGLDGDVVALLEDAHLEDARTVVEALDHDEVHRVEATRQHDLIDLARHLPQPP
eukprot:CAMPEP_0179317054 /NCGR_PEP_ID=MMETSP0797-20121207/56042_1 /TAXON_ID=47934 /ORGANISM="Dinophysis acuminata, Strain DAEP01" /LENGTH=177 /DNA_ID=CAMNT_0021027923 /DNA_START=85 /DNA_END=615 /DNA_ORIENTATION=+